MRDQPDSSADLADLAHVLLVPVAVEHDHHEVADADPLLLGHQLERLADRPVQVEQVRQVARCGHLQHVDAGPGVEHRAALGESDRGNRVRKTLGAQLGSLERIDGDVDLGRRSVADVLAVVEHGRLVLLALADHDHAVHGHGVEQHPHRVHRRAVGALLVAAPDPAGAGKRGVLGRTHELHREVAIGLRSPRFHGAGRYMTPGGLRAVS